MPAPQSAPIGLHAGQISVFSIRFDRLADSRQTRQMTSLVRFRCTHGQYRTRKRASVNFWMLACLKGLKWSPDAAPKPPCWCPCRSGGGYSQLRAPR